MLRLIGETSIGFMGLRRIGYILSVVLLVTGIGAMFSKNKNTGQPLNFGIDFAGGTIVQVKFKQEPPLDVIRPRLDAADLTKTSIQRFGAVADREIIIRVSEQTEESRDIVGVMRDALYTSEAPAGLKDLNNVGRREIAAALARMGGDEAIDVVSSYDDVATGMVDARTALGGIASDFDAFNDVEGFTPEVRALAEQAFFFGDFNIMRVESVGPAVGADLKETAVKSILWAICGILIYIWVRFDWRFGLAAVICLAHDVGVTVGAFALTGREVDLPVVAALLTIVGYSLNDTIVVFDRIRDNIRLMRRESFDKMIDTSINQTLSRTLLTSVTTLIVVLSLYLLGGGVINGFAFALLVGVLVGTYSSIFVASAMLFEISRGKVPRISS